MRTLLVFCVLGMSSAVAQQAATPTPRISGGVMAGQILTRVDPVYPQDAKDAHIGGSVVLHAIISREGLVKDLSVVSGTAVLRDAATDAVKQWTYKPYLLNGRPTEVDTTITVNFTLPVAGPSGTFGNPQRSQPLPPLPLTPGRYRLSSGVIAGQKLSGEMPNFCEIGREQRVNGSVVLHVVVDRSGHVSEATGISGPQLLLPAAIDAVKTWTYKPYLLNGNPIEVDTLITMSESCGG